MLPEAGGVYDEWNEPDEILSYLILTLVNGMNVSLGVTVTVRGLVISGTLVSERTYLESVTRTLQSQINFDDPNVPEDVRESLNDLLDLRELAEYNLVDQLDGLIDNMPEDGSEMDEDFLEEVADIMPDRPHYLHMKDPLMLAGDPPVNFGEGSDAILRLRLTSIDSWMLGRLISEIPDFTDFDDGSLKH